MDHLSIRALLFTLRSPPWIRYFLTSVPAVIEGQHLDDRTRLFLSLIRLNPIPFHRYSVRAQRKEVAFVDRVLSAPLAPVAIREIPVPLPGRTRAARVYVPPGGGTRPGLLYLHGGGFTIGTPVGYDAPCARIAHACDCVVVSLDYRLAPEHRFPAALDDAVDGFLWLTAHGADLGIATGQLAMGGDSAGGSLTAAATRLLVRRGAPAPIMQLLLYPATDMNSILPSKTTFARGFFLTTAHVEWFYDQYVPDPAERYDPRASPLLADDLAGLPPVLLITAGLDPIRDEGRAYGAKLAAAGVKVEAVEVEGMVHGFITLDGVLPAADRAMTDLSRMLRSYLHQKESTHGSPGRSSIPPFRPDVAVDSPPDGLSGRLQRKIW